MYLGVEKKESDMATSRLNEELKNKTNQINDLNKKIESLSGECNQKTRKAIHYSFSILMKN